MLEPNAFGIIFTFLKDVAKITPAKNIGAETRDMPKILSKKESNKKVLGLIKKLIIIIY